MRIIVSYFMILHAVPLHPLLQLVVVPKSAYVRVSAGMAVSDGLGHPCRRYLAGELGAQGVLGL